MFLVTAGPDLNDSKGSPFRVTTWTFTTTHGKVGTDTVTGQGIYQGQPFTCTPTTVTWTLPRCEAHPASYIEPFSSTIHATTTNVIDGAGTPVQTTLWFNVIGANSSFQAQTTDANGDATFWYGSAHPGKDAIIITGSFGSIPISCGATVIWLPPVQKVEIICRPLSVKVPQFLNLPLNPVLAQHCYFLATFVDGSRHTFSAFPSTSGQLEGVIDADMGNGQPNIWGGCGAGPLNSYCFTIENTNPEVVVTHLLGKTQTPDGTRPTAGQYVFWSNNSNLWVKQRLNDLLLNVPLPSRAVSSIPEAYLVLDDILRSGVPANIVAKIIAHHYPDKQ